MITRECYLSISSEVAMGLADFQIFHEKPKVYMSLSDRMPGYFMKSHVPPRFPRLSRMAKVALPTTIMRRKLRPAMVLMVAIRMMMKLTNVRISLKMPLTMSCAAAGGTLHPVR